MPLVNMTDMLDHAYRHNYAIGSFDLVSLDFLAGVLAAAENRHSPVILSLAESHFEHYDFEVMMAAVLAAAKRATVPVVVHLDHAISLETVHKGIGLGCNSVMIDASAASLSDNMHLTQEVVALARASGVAVEGELGYVPGVEGDYVALHPGELVYTTPAQAKTYVERTGVDSLAVSVGTVHGRMQGTAKLDYTRLGKINEALGMPLVIHGGTGLTDDQFRRLIAHGVAKINYYTGLSDAAGAAVLQRSVAGEKSYTSLTHTVRDAVREEVERCMRVWGSGGRAAEVLAQCRPWQEIEKVVLFNADGRLESGEISSLLARGKESLAAIPGVRSVVHGVALQPDARYRQCSLIRFASEAAVSSYRDHPEHLNYADSMFRLATADRILVNYKIDT